MSSDQIPGYDYGADEIPDAPISTDEFERLQRTVLFDEDDEEYLRMAGDVLEGQIDDVLEVWYGFVADHDFLVYYFTDGDGNPDEEYLERVRERFGQWIRDTCDAPYDREWLAYQFEIGRRHTREKKNEVDDADAVDHIDMRYLVAFVYPITATIREFLADSDHSEADVDAMYHAWFKSVVLQVTLWTYAYVPDENW
ncbi:protoglobin domain-containing protein [Natrinema salsiterrestre]|uniref:Protoglobin domain-containing protein n=1 Tax=Natrinema salsiterrestre TaxID=2950540 RepID=A0A9Q4L2K1_9EURY|nr:protoglobin domain-containing protein [Natrinema salsiterrestre]MDF9747021.1 protoglobin domain-containing protein [Natrinema salsiterrestre]